jgi:hypothetical protein
VYEKLRINLPAGVFITLAGVFAALAVFALGCARSDVPPKTKTHDTGCLVERTEVIKQELHGLDHHIWEQDGIIKSLEGKDLHVEDVSRRYLTVLSAHDRKRYTYQLAEHPQMTDKGKVVLFNNLRVGLPVEVGLDGTTITELSVVRP